jgi:hypothetical protein
LIKRCYPVQEAFRTPNRQDQKRTSQTHIIVKNTKYIEQERIRAAREKQQVIDKGKSIRITAYF